MADTLYDFYTGQGQNLPSIADRSKIFESSGLGNATDYQGTAEQNTSLLNNLQTPITETDAQAPDIDVPEQENPYDIASWGQGQTQKSANEVFESAKKDLQDRKKEQETLRLEEADQSGLIDKLKETMDQTINKGTDTFEAIKDSGYYDLEKKDLAVQNSIDALGASLALGIVDEQGRPTIAAFSTGKIAQMQNMAAAKMGALAVQSLAIQGKMAQAKSQAEDMVNAKYAPIEQEIANQKEILKLNMDNLSNTDKIRADELLALNEEKAEIVADNKAKENYVLDLLAEATSNEAPDSVLEAIKNSGGDVAKAIIAAKGYLGDKDVDETGTVPTKIGQDKNGNDIFFDPVTQSVKTGEELKGGFVGDNGITSQSGNSYDMTTYAEDDKHPKSVQKNLDKIGKFNSISDIDEYIKKIAPSSGITGQMIANSAAKYGIGWEELVALVEHESFIGTSNVANNNNNPGGISWNSNFPEDMQGTGKPVSEGGRPYVKFDTMQDGLNSVAYELSKRKVDMTDVENEDFDEKDYDSFRKKINNNTSVSDASETVMRDVERALEFMTNPIFGDNTFSSSMNRIALSKIPGNPMYEWAKSIESAKSNIGIDKLLEIKASGAGLGQVPQSQLETLQSVLGLLDISRDPKLLKEDLENILNKYNSVIDRVGNENSQLANQFPHYAKMLSVGGEQPTTSGVDLSDIDFTF